MSLQTGAVLNQRYRIAALLGQGGFGAVYRAWDLNLNKNCAVKESFQTTADASRQFTREASILASLHHPSLPRVTDHFIISGQGQYLVMDYIEGDDLQTMIERTGRPLPEGQVLAWAGQICDALTYLHTQNPPVIHRDLKPANIRITPQGQAVLVDFGIAKLFNPNVATTTGARALSPGYAPVEQYGQGGRTDHRSDVYSLSATLYAALTARQPVESIERTIGAQLITPRSFNPAISPQTEAAILKGLQLSPHDRFQSAAELKRALPVTGSRPAVMPTMLPTSTTGQPGIERPPSNPTNYGPASIPLQPVAPGTGPAPAATRLPAWAWLAAGGAGLVILVGVIALIGFIALMGRPTPTLPPTAVVLFSTPTATFSFRAAETPTGTTAPTQFPTETPTEMPSATVFPTCPPPAGWTTYTVQQNDTLYAIAITYGVSLDDLLAANCLTVNDPFLVGTILYVPASTPSPTPNLGTTQISAVDGMVMIYIPDGEFLMGSTSGDPYALPDEKPQHSVYIDAYWIDQVEVTNAMFAKFVADTGHSTTAENVGKGYVWTGSWEFMSGADWRHPVGPSSSLSGRDNHPVVQVSWADAESYCAWAGRRLPSEAEWEKAARGTDGPLYPWGSASPAGSRLNYDDTIGATTAVGSYPSGASPYGLYDTLGNVFEWVSDWFSDSYYLGSPSTNPQGPSSGSDRVMRGGSWHYGIQYARTASRAHIYPDYTGDTLGFRCAVSP